MGHYDILVPSVSRTSAVTLTGCCDNGWVAWAGKVFCTEVVVTELVWSCCCGCWACATRVGQVFGISKLVCPSLCHENNHQTSKISRYNNQMIFAKRSICCKGKLPARRLAMKHQHHKPVNYTLTKSVLY